MPVTVELAVVVVLLGAVIASPLVEHVQQRHVDRTLSRARADRARRAVRAADEFATVDTLELEQWSRLALVDLDEALRSTQKALPHARVRLGPRRALELEAVLDGAQAAHAQASDLRRTLDDAAPGSERAVRDAATQIVRACERAAARLHGQQAAIDEVRALEADVGAALATLAAETSRVRSRAADARQALAALRDRHPPDALAPFVSDLDRADALLADVDRTLTRGRERAVAGARTGAVGCVRVAEETLAQVQPLLVVVESADAELAATGVRLDAGVVSLTADLTDVERLACADDPHVAVRAREARAALAAAGDARSGTGDPRAVLRRLTAAEVALDAALAPRRDAAEQYRRAAALVDGVVADVGIELRVVRSFVETHRGVVGSGARTRLVQSEEWHRCAVGQRATDPVTALADAQRAGELVHDAERLARRDVSSAQAHGWDTTALRGAPARRVIRAGWHSRGSPWGDDDQDPG